MSADTVFFGPIYTVESNNGAVWAECCAVRDGKIIFVGNKEDGQKFVSGSTQIITIPDDGLLLPGFRM